jgi:hypothetical protein
MMTYEERRKALKRWAAAMKRESEAGPHGSYTSNPEPPGDWWDWQSVILHKEAFAAAGLCELWRMDFGDETRFFRFSDFPPGFDFACMMWRPA